MLQLDLFRGKAVAAAMVVVITAVAALALATSPAQAGRSLQDSESSSDSAADSAGGSGATATVTATSEITPPSTIDLVMYMSSQPNDDDSCAMVADGDVLVISPEITNPAMSCPDMYSWKLLIDAMRNEFWKNWAADHYVFPSNPYPLCEEGATDLSACCAVGNLANPGYDDSDNPGMHCPYFPGDHLGDDGSTVLTRSAQQSKAQSTEFEITTEFEGISEGRAIRQEVAEVVYRNPDMVNYIFENGIYHTDGLIDVYERASSNMANRAPAHARDVTGELARINFPIQSVMVKTNWMHEERAAALGIENDPSAPFITMNINTQTIDNFGVSYAPGLHYLISIHISSKDIPNWVWTTFEHVNNPGRCDMIGCKDSFGYVTSDAVHEDQYDNFVTPHQRNDNLVLAQTIFDNGKNYPAETRRPALEQIFDAFEIGTADAVGDEELPSISDPAWQSYRLKGSQVDFTDSTGRPILLGNSVTEGGFVGTSSCTSCHARAALNESGKINFAVFDDILAEDGYPQSVNGVPNHAWYYTVALGDRFATTPKVRTVQSDFVWGFIFAQPLDTSATE